MKGSLLLCALLAAAGAAEADSLTLYSVATGDDFVELDRPGGIGDKVLWHSDLEDEAGERVGRNAGHCTRLDASGARHCNFFIDHEGHGAMTFSGVQLPEPQPSTVVITGGTGEYEGATGSVVSTPVEDRARFRYEIEYMLPGS